MFVNVVRVSGTAILADYDSRLAMGFYHTFSGWLVFLLGIVFAGGDIRELVHQIQESRTTVATIAGILIGLHLLAAAAAGVAFRQLSGPARS